MDFAHLHVGICTSKTLKIIMAKARLGSKLQWFETARWPENMSRHQRSFGTWSDE